MHLTLEQFGLDQLTAEEWREVYYLLEASFPPEVDDAPLSAAQMAEIERRVAVARANPGQGTPWEVVREQSHVRVSGTAVPYRTPAPLTLAQFGLDELNQDEKLELMVLLDAVRYPRQYSAQSPELPAEQRERAERMDADPGRGVPWETPEFLAEMLRRVADARSNPGSGIPAEEVYHAAVARSRARRGL